MTVVDVGANCGYYTLLATLAWVLRGEYLPLSPALLFFSNLLAVVAGNALPNVIPLQAAFGKRPGRGSALSSA